MKLFKEQRALRLPRHSLISSVCVLGACANITSPSSFQNMHDLGSLFIFSSLIPKEKHTLECSHEPLHEVSSISSYHAGKLSHRDRWSC